jgi:hypothetical protein
MRRTDNEVVGPSLAPLSRRDVRLGGRRVDLELRPDGDDGLWLEVHDAAWGYSTAYRLHRQGGTLVIAEIGVFPCPADTAPGATERPPGRSDPEAPVPAGGIGRRALQRNLSTEECLAWVSRLLASGAQLESPWNAFAVSPVQRAAKRRSGRPTAAASRSDLWYAQIASEYADRVRRNSRRPNAEIAEARDDLGPGGVKVIEDAIRECRNRRQLLTTTEPGRPGGELTEKAKQLLAAEAVPAPAP